VSPPGVHETMHQHLDTDKGDITSVVGSSPGRFRSLYTNSETTIIFG